MRNAAFYAPIPDRPKRPTKHVPKSLYMNCIGTLDDGALSIGYRVRRKLEDSRYPLGYLLVDVDRRAYLVTRKVGSLDDVLQAAPQVLVGCYARGVDVAIVIGDLEDHMRSAA